MSELRIGYIFAFGAYFLWGFFPAYWKLLKHLGADQILAHRVFWSLLFYLGIWNLFFRKSGRKIALNKKLTIQIGLAALVVASNWFVYIWAVNSGHVLETSLGYFINPLVNVVLGYLVLGEYLSQKKWIAIGLATCGVFVMALQVKEIWISLYLAFSFGVYGLLRKVMKAPPIQTSALETLFLSIPAMTYAGVTWDQTANWDSNTFVLLATGGIVTGLPLWWFAEAASRIPLSTLGVFQYIAPSLQFLQAVWLFQEPFGRVQAASFLLIWIGLLLFTMDLVGVQKS